MHAYLIMVHEKPDFLKILLQRIDNPNNDIYIHIDSKASGFDEVEVAKWTSFSKIHFIKSKSVTWGAYSQIEVEINLLEEAILLNYEYYHLISGIDFPLKESNEVIDFFEQNKGKEFIQFQNKNLSKKNLNRVRYFYPFQEYVGKKKNFLWGFQKLLVLVQKLFHVDRTKKNKMFSQFQMGANWFSITHNLAKHVVSKKADIKKTFKYTINGDELFLQTIVVNSKFSNYLYHMEFDNSTESNTRFVKWENDTPIILNEHYYDRLKTGEECFARKFDKENSGKLIEMLLDKDK